MSKNPQTKTDLSYTGLAEVFRIFAKYDASSYGQIAAEHDVIYAGPDPNIVSAEDEAALAAHSWRPEPDYGCYSRSV